MFFFLADMDTVQYTDTAMGNFYPLNFIPTAMSLSESSSSFTVGNSFAVNEIFRIQIEHMVPAGQHIIRVVASKTHNKNS